MKNQGTQRTYKSDKRQQQAENTRLAIIDAGRKLFLERGYTETTVAAVAAEAGVAVPTVYASVGGKQGVLMNLVNFVDELGDEALIKQGLDEADPTRIIQLAIKFHRQTIERGGDIIKFILTSAPFNKDVASALKEALARNREVAAKLAELLIQRGPLRPHLTEKQAGDIIAMMLTPTIFDTLGSFGWSFDECEAWLTDTLIGSLLGRDT